MSLVFQNVRLCTGAFSFELDTTCKGHVTGIFGPSGAGKTTLLEIVAGLRHPEAGIVRHGDTVLTDVAAGVQLPPERRRIGYLPQDGALFPHLNVRQNLLYGRRNGTPVSRIGSLEQVCVALDITAFTERRITGLSGGERQRVALARALLAGPRLLLLDEPLASLDAGHKAAILPYLQRIRAEFGVPLLYVSHHPEEMFVVCDEILVLANGRLAAQDAPPALFERTAEPHYCLRPVCPRPLPK
jgi:molybdate transport system ATP-binding protein